jgi:pyruvate dehydrogenase E2 component (dihydrolipoamide acetyltransferase)
MKTGLVVEWLKRPGDSVQKGEPIVQIESEKATNEVEAPATGIMRWLGVQEGEDASVGAALAVIIVPGEELTDEQVAALIREDAEIKRQKAELLTGSDQRNGNRNARNCQGTGQHRWTRECFTSGAKARTGTWR